MIDFQKLIDLQYLLDLTPEPQTQFLIPLLIVFSATTLLSILVWFWLGYLEKKFAPLENIKKRLFNFLFTVGIIGLVLLFLRWQAIPYLSLRIWLVLLLLTVLVWFIFILRYVIVKYPQEKREFLGKKQIEKYLPKKRSTRIHRLDKLHQ